MRVCLSVCVYMCERMRVCFYHHARKPLVRARLHASLSAQSTEKYFLSLIVDDDRVGQTDRRTDTPLVCGHKALETVLF